MIKTRFCPSPTGRIHVGNVRTALFNALLAAHMGGIFLLRIEDTDLERSKQAHADALFHDLKWLGIDWQEGAQVGGPAGPYYQSQRSDIYARYYQQLMDMGRAYPCFCTDETLALSRKLQLASGRPPRYAGTCRQLTEAQRQEKIKAGEMPALRFRMADDEEIRFEDLVKGQQRFHSAEIGDFIIRRADGGSAFMFCNAIDDSLMNVTHALRGEDHLTNTPRQLAILRCLKMPEPHYGHISLILGQDGAPLSKRNGSRSVQDLRDSGYFSLGVMNYLARLGHYYENNEYLSFEKLAGDFRIKNLTSSPARYDENQLRHWQKEAMMTSNIQALEPCFTLTSVPTEKRTAFIQLIQPNIEFPQEAEQYAERFFGESLTFSAEAEAVLESTPPLFYRTALGFIKVQGIDYQALTEHLKTQLGVKGKMLFQPLRVALTGQLHGPELAAVMQLMGKEKVIQRLEVCHKNKE